MKTKALQRSKKFLEDNGWQVAIVEKWIPPRGAMKFGVRRDVWGFGDLLASRNKVISSDGPRGLATEFRIEKSIALVQCCADSGGKAGMEAHKQKMLKIGELYSWKSAGGIVLLHGWKLRGPRGQRKRWILTEWAL